MELATGKFPYPKWNSVFDQLTQVVQGPAPQLKSTEGRFSEEFLNFLNTWWALGILLIFYVCLKYMSSCVLGYGLRRQHLCKHVSSCFCSLTKDEKQRPKYAKLLVSIRFLVFLHYKALKLAITVPKFKRKIILILFFIWNIISDTVIKTSFANLEFFPLCCRSIPLSNDIVNWKLTLPVMWWKFSITCERQTQTCRSSLPPTLDKAGLLLRAFNSGTT